jgi:hypothetical protein
MSQQLNEDDTTHGLRVRSVSGFHTHNARTKVRKILPLVARRLQNTRSQDELDLDRSLLRSQ